MKELSGNIDRQQRPASVDVCNGARLMIRDKVIEFDTSAANLTATAWAKVNLCLHVCCKRADGLHELQSLVCFADFGDSLTLHLNEPLRLTIDGPFASGLSEQNNIILTAARLYAHAIHGGDVCGRFHLVKRIPVASGIGGGSADAALALHLLDTVNGKRAREKMYDMAVKLGADVLACLIGDCCWMQGTGATLSPARIIHPLYALLVNPGIPVSTFSVFTALDVSDLASEWIDSLPYTWTCSEDFLVFLRNSHNSLEETATRIVPDIGLCIEAIRATTGCLLARMSGSGATVFGLYESSTASHDAAASLRLSYPDWWMQPVMLGTSQNLTRRTLSLN